MNADPDIIRLALESDASLREEWKKAKLNQHMLAQVPKTNLKGTLKQRYILNPQQQKSHQKYVKEINNLIERTMLKVQEIARQKNKSFLSEKSDPQQLLRTNSEPEEISFLSSNSFEINNTLQERIYQTILDMPPKKMVGLMDEPSLEMVDENYLSDDKNKKRTINHSERKVSKISDFQNNYWLRNSSSKVPRDTESRILSKQKTSFIVQQTKALVKNQLYLRNHAKLQQMEKKEVVDISPEKTPTKPKRRQSSGLNVRFIRSTPQREVKMQEQQKPSSPKVMVPKSTGSTKFIIKKPDKIVQYHNPFLQKATPVIIPPSPKIVNPKRDTSAPKIKKKTFLQNILVNKIVRNPGNTSLLHNPSTISLLQNPGTTSDHKFKFPPPPPQQQQQQVKEPIKHQKVSTNLQLMRARSRQAKEHAHRMYLSSFKSESRLSSKLDISIASSSKLPPRMKSPVIPGGCLIPKSEQLLVNIFLNEFWPITQKLLQQESDTNLIMLLDTHELKFCEGKRMEESFLWQDSEFKARPQEHRRETKTRLCIQHRSQELPLGIYNVESLMRQMGFLKSDDMEERGEFMKFWAKIVLQEKEEIKAQKAKVRRNEVQPIVEDVEAKYIQADEDILTEYLNFGGKLQMDGEEIQEEEPKEIHYVKVKNLLEGLLNIAGISKTNMRFMAPKFKKLRQNRNEFYKENKRSISPTNRKSRNSVSIIPKKKNQDFGSFDFDLKYKKSMHGKREVSPFNSVSYFTSNLRNYQKASPKKRKNSKKQYITNTQILPDRKQVFLSPSLSPPELKSSLKLNNMSQSAPRSKGYFKELFNDNNNKVIDLEQSNIQLRISPADAVAAKVEPQPKQLKTNKANLTQFLTKDSSNWRNPYLKKKQLETTQELPEPQSSDVSPKDPPNNWDFGDKEIQILTKLQENMVKTTNVGDQVIDEAIREDSIASSKEDVMMLRTETAESGLQMEPNNEEFNEMRDEVVDFMNRRSSPKINRLISPKSRPKIKFDLPQLFPEENDQIEYIQPISSGVNTERQNFRRSQTTEVAAPKVPSSVQALSYVDSARSSSTKKFISKLPGKNLPPVTERVSMPSQRGLKSVGTDEQTFGKVSSKRDINKRGSQKMRGQPKQSDTLQSLHNIDSLPAIPAPIAEIADIVLLSPPIISSPPKKDSEEKKQKDSGEQKQQTPDYLKKMTKKYNNSPEKNLRIPHNRVESNDSKLAIAEDSQKNPQKTLLRSSKSLREQKSDCSSAQVFNFFRRDGSRASSSSIYQLPSSNGSQFRPRPIIKFEIYVDSQIGTQDIEISSKKNIKENVENFARKYGITDSGKINKLRKYIKSQFKELN